MFVVERGMFLDKGLKLFGKAIERFSQIVPAKTGQRRLIVDKSL